MEEEYNNLCTLSAAIYTAYRNNPKGSLDAKVEVFWNAVNDFMKEARKKCYSGDITLEEYDEYAADVKTLVNNANMHKMIDECCTDASKYHL